MTETIKVTESLNGGMKTFNAISSGDCDVKNPVILRDVTCTAPVNIAIVKYWGKRDESLHLPLNASLSVTLDQANLATQTRIRLSRDFPNDSIFINGEKAPINNRVATCLQEIRRRARKRENGENCDQSVPAKKYSVLDSSTNARIDSFNNFPTAAGLASSAAGYACLVATLAKAYGVEGEISDIARRGSGSACRSMYGGFVEWDPGFDGQTSIAKQIFPSSHWPELRVCIVVVSDSQKAVSSSDGMKKSVETSQFLRHRAEVIVPQHMTALRSAIATKDFEAFGSLAMRESNSLHACCLDTFPPIHYLGQTSKDIMGLVAAINTALNRIALAYSFDAGCNAFLFHLENDTNLLLPLLCHAFNLDIQDSNQVKGLKDDFSDVKMTLDDSLSDVLDHFQFLKGKVKFLLRTKPGPGPKVVADSYTD